jgi:hypothetical protein
LDGQSSDPEGQRFVRYFTLEEANALLPTLIPILVQLKEAKEQFDQLRRSLEVITPTMRGNGHGAIAVDYERRINELVTRISDEIRQIVEMGVEVKDLNQGLIDFPHWRDDRVVFLCWRLGEPAISFWHEIDAGFAGRQELRASDDPFDPPFPLSL